MMEKYILPLFDPSSSVAVVVSAPGNVEHTAKGLSNLGFDVENKELEVPPEELMELEEDGSYDGSEDESDGERR